MKTKILGMLEGNTEEKNTIVEGILFDYHSQLEGCLASVFCYFQNGDPAPVNVIEKIVANKLCESLRLVCLGAIQSPTTKRNIPFSKDEIDDANEMFVFRSELDSFNTEE